MNEEDQPLFSLFHLGLSIHHLNQRAEKQLGMSLGHWCLLRRLIDMPATSAHALAGAVGVHPSTLTQTLKRLEKRAFLFVTGDPKDSRKKLISITRSGKEALDRAEQRFGKQGQPLAEMNSELLELRRWLGSQITPLSEGVLEEPKRYRRNDGRNESVQE